MAYTFVTTQAPQYLHFTVEGDNTADTVRGYLNEIAQVCARQGCARVLIEENLRGPSFSMSDVYAVVAEAARKVPPTLRKIAFVDVNPTHRVENMQFAETVAVNRGVNVRRFATVEEAVDWLGTDGDSGN